MWHVPLGHVAHICGAGGGTDCSQTATVNPAHGDAQRGNAWLAWLDEAHLVVSRWEEARGGGGMLSVAHAALLAEEIAQALQRAYDSGTARTNQ
jgi:hypothetical protein